MPIDQRLKQVFSLKNVIILLIIVAGIAGTGYFYYINQQNQNEIDRLKENPQELERELAEDLIAEIGKVVDLPLGETPTIATVQDATKLNEQPFFSEAENGDKLLIYTKAKKAFLYRPSTNKIIEIAPVSIGEEDKTTPSENP